MYVDKEKKVWKRTLQTNTVVTFGQFQDVQNYDEGQSELTLADVFNFVYN